MSEWFYAAVFLLLNVFIFCAMQRINRHLAAMSRQLEAAVGLLVELNSHVKGLRQRASGIPELDRR